MKPTIQFTLTAILFVLCFVGEVKAREYTPDTNTIALWHFNETSGGTVADASGNGNNGTATGTTIVDGRFGKAKYFNGTSDYIIVPLSQSLMPESSLTVECWIFPTGNGGTDARIIREAGANGFLLAWKQELEEKIQFRIDKSGITKKAVDNVPNTTYLNSWHHVAGVYSINNGVKLYIDGKLRSTDIHNGTIIYDAPSLLIGWGSGPEYFEGYIDEVRISKIAREPSEFNIPDLVAYYPFNGNANDESGYGNHGTLSGATLSSDRFGSTNKAYNFDGVNDEIIVPNSTFLNFDSLHPMSTTVWVYRIGNSQIPPYMHILGKRQANTSVINYQIAWEPSKGYTFNNRKNDIVSEVKSNSQNSPLNCWTNISGVFNGQKLFLYINGKLIDSTIGTLGDITTYAFKIGNSGENPLWQGYIDDIRIYNRALSESEIDSLYHENGWDPQVTLVTPSQNALNISKSTNISATFNVAMNTASLNTSNILVYGSQSGKHAGTITLSGDTAFTFNPATDFKAGEVVSVTLTKNILSASGDSLMNGWHWSFTVQAIGGTATFTKTQELLVDEAPGYMSSGDFDMDGDIDIVVGNSGSQTSSLLKNNGNGFFDTIPYFQSGMTPYPVASGDVDGDGDLDIIVANVSTDTISLLFNNTGIFIRTTISGQRIRDAALNDFDGDGDLDLAVTAVDSNKIFIFRNGGTGSLTKTSSINLNDQPLSIATSDINRDGSMDLIVTVNRDGNIGTAITYKNQGDGTFVQAFSESNIGVTQGTLVVGDLNTDGSQDLILPIDINNKVTILKNNNPESFTILNITGFSGQARTVAIGDLDGDGDLDPVVPTYSTTYVMLYRNEGSMNFATLPYIILQNVPWASSLADFDGDGDLDMAVTEPNVNKVAILMNDYQEVTFGFVTGTKFNDFNGNGIKDESEGVLENWSIYLSGAASETTLTDANGNYLFDSLEAGTYIITEEERAGWVRTSDSSSYTIAISSGDTVTNKNFGNFQLASISGKKFHDADADSTFDGNDGVLESWSIVLSGAVNDTVMTDANGDYSFTNLTAGKYLVREIQQSGWTQTTPNPDTITIQSGSNVTGVNFGNSQNGRISGFKFEDVDGDGVYDNGEPKLSGWTIILYGTVVRTTLTDGSGNFSFIDLPAGIYQLNEAPQTGWVKTSPEFHTIILPSGAQLDTMNFGNFRYGSISGMKFNDVNADGAKQPSEPFLANWRITLTSSNNSLSTLTDGSGNFNFDSLLAGTYTISEEERIPWYQTIAPYNPLTIVSGTSLSSQNFGNVFRVGCSVIEKWNMVSNPLQPARRKIILFSDASSPAFKFYGGYVPSESLFVGTGYWLKFPSADTVQIFGTEVTSDTIDVQADWNLIGSLSSAIPVTCVEPIGTTVLSNYFEYETGYVASEMIEPCKAYWVKVSSSGKLALRSECALSKTMLHKR